MTMAIENREVGPNADSRRLFPGLEPLALEERFRTERTYVRPFLGNPAVSEPPAGKGKFRQELMDLFIEYFCKENPIYLKRLMNGVEKCIILKVLTRVNGNQKEAARILGIKYTTLNQKVKKYGIRFQKGIRFLDS